jgi:uncharacterized membrane protein
MAHLQAGIRTGSSTKNKQYKPKTKDMDSGEERGEESSENVGNTERLLSGIVGGGLLLRSVRGRSGIISGLTALMGIALLQRAATGYCPAYNAIGVTTRNASDTSSLGRPKIKTDRALKIEQSIIIQRSPRDLYRFWRQVDNLPKVMSHIRSVEAINDYRSHWIVDTLPGAPTIEWDAEIINEVENERIGWKTLQGALVEHAGSVVFEPLEKKSTMLTVTLQYDPPGGPLGAAIAHLFGQDPAKKIGDDLLRFKEAMETEVSHPK